MAHVFTVVSRARDMGVAQPIMKFQKQLLSPSGSKVDAYPVPQIWYCLSDYSRYVYHVLSMVDCSPLYTVRVDRLAALHRETPCTCAAGQVTGW